ncbi:hypothetical protein ACJMK2_026292 [Sinanodonta woodiana]|uniref:lysozyme n=1 Tax=Sinanodonta woodiana TaxID=1069815 RepID=A0ABD3XMU6_SINWO
MPISNINIVILENRKENYHSKSDAIDCYLIRNISLVESKCQPIGCVMDVGSLSCGYYQIKLPYYQDCGSPGRDWKTCADDYSCATTCVKNYMARYGPHSGCPDTCETYARIHNGGPNGCNNPNTIPYWHKVQSYGC